MPAATDGHPGELERIRLRGCRQRPSDQRDRLARDIYERLHPVMGALGLLFLVVLLSEGAVTDSWAIDLALKILTWLLWVVFVAEFAIRVVISPSARGFLRRNWWQLLFLLVPFLAIARSLLVFRLSRPARVAMAALRGSRSAGATLSSRVAWMSVVTAIVVFSAADMLFRSGALTPYSKALRAAAVGAVSGEPSDAEGSMALVIDVVLALYSAIVFAALAGMLGAFFLEQRGERRSALERSPTAE